MPNLNLEEFNPTVAELTKLASESEGLTIAGLDDLEGYNRVKEARITLKNTRCEIERVGKKMRSDALAFQKAVIKKQNDLIAIIEPVEKDLERQQKMIDIEKTMAVRRKHLPEKMARLKAIGVEVSDDLILSMDDHEFSEFLVARKAELLDAREAELKAKEEAIAEAERVEAIKEQGRQEVIARQEQSYKDEAVQAGLALQDKTIKAWLKENGYTEETKEEFIIRGEGKTINLFRKVSSLTLK